MNFDRKDLSNEELIKFYRALLWPRMIEEKMLVLLRQGKISKWFSGIGQEAIAVGIALAYKLRKEHKVSLAFTGEGGTSEGDFHEALNVAAVWDLPVIFLIENNGYALSTPTNEQYRCVSLVDKAKSYGMEGVTI